MSSEQKIRAFLFYLSVGVFLITLPFILSFALGYKFNPHSLKFTKTGIIVLKTQPAGADIYFGQKLLKEKTPATLEELLPGMYNIRLEAQNCYPWFNNVAVEAGRVTRLEKIILFSRRPNIKQLNKDRLSALWIDERKDKLYYVNREGAIYRAELEGERFEQVGHILEIRPPPLKWKVSLNGEKLAYFNMHQIAIVPLEPKASSLSGPFILNYPDRRLNDVFWHSDSYHLIIITNKNIEVIEVRANPLAVNLVNLNQKDTFSFYDTDNDALFFLDYQKAHDAQWYNNLYKLDLKAKEFYFQGLIKNKTDAQGKKD